MRTLKNAESNESTLRLLNSTKVDFSDRVKIEKKKNFPNLTFGTHLYFILLIESLTDLKLKFICFLF